VNEKIPVMFDRMLRPEWIDYALQQFLAAENETALRSQLLGFLEGQLQGQVTIQKVARQLNRTVGFKSSISRAKLQEYHDKMSALSPDERMHLRLQILVESTPFAADCVNALKKLSLLGVDGVNLTQLYDRQVARYGDRSMVYRRVRYVLQTLAFLGAVQNRDQKWYLAAWVE
jgi:hypothetical protein